jgi:hypothetical protein
MSVIETKLILEILRVPSALGGSRLRIMATAPARRIGTQEVSYAVIMAAMRVHSELGPDLLKALALLAYSTNCEKPGFFSEAQMGLPVVYDGVKLAWLPYRPPRRKSCCR